MSFPNWNQLLAHVAIAVPIFKMTFAGARMKSNDVQCFYYPFSFLEFTKLVNEFFSWKNTRSIPNFNNIVRINHWKKITRV
jgi:hypothetical protein